MWRGLAWFCMVWNGMIWFGIVYHTYWGLILVSVLSRGACTPAHTACTQAHTACTPAHSVEEMRIQLTQSILAGARTELGNIVWKAEAIMISHRAMKNTCKMFFLWTFFIHLKDILTQLEYGVDIGKIESPTLVTVSCNSTTELRLWVLKAMWLMHLLAKCVYWDLFWHTNQYISTHL